MKKGDLSLSTSAIVALIVAVVVLGLVLVFIFRAGGSTSDMISKLEGQRPEPTEATRAKPVTVSAPTRAQIGEAFVVKIAVFNAADADLLYDPVVTNCFALSEYAMNSVGRSGETIPQGQSSSFTLLVEIPSVIDESQRAICEVTNAAATDGQPSASFTIALVQ